MRVEREKKKGEKKERREKKYCRNLKQVVAVREGVEFCLRGSNNTTLR